MILMKAPQLLLPLASLLLAVLPAHAAAAEASLDENEKPVQLPVCEVRVDRLDPVQKDVRDRLNQLRAVARQPVKVQVDLPLLKLTRADLPTKTVPTAPVPGPVVIAGV